MVHAETFPGEILDLKVRTHLPKVKQPLLRVDLTMVRLPLSLLRQLQRLSTKLDL